MSWISRRIKREWTQKEGRIQAQIYRFTLDNCGDDEYCNIKERLKHETSYSIIGRKVGRNGLLQLSGYLRFKKRVAPSRVKLFTSLRSNVSRAPGTTVDMVESYRRDCMTFGADFWEHGRRFPSNSVGLTGEDSNVIYRMVMTLDRFGSVKLWPQDECNSNSISPDHHNENDDEIVNVSSNDENGLTYECTACLFRIGNYADAALHPLIDCLICRRCQTRYGDGNFANRENGIDSFGDDNYCRWCCEGGDLFGCSNAFSKNEINRCHYSFCKNCIEKNTPNDPVLRVNIMTEEEKAHFTWFCFVCDKTKLSRLRQESQDAMKELYTKGIYEIASKAIKIENISQQNGQIHGHSTNQSNLNIIVSNPSLNIPMIWQPLGNPVPREDLEAERKKRIDMHSQTAKTCIKKFNSTLGSILVMLESVDVSKNPRASQLINQEIDTLLNPIWDLAIMVPQLRKLTLTP